MHIKWRYCDNEPPFPSSQSTRDSSTYICVSSFTARNISQCFSLFLFYFRTAKALDIQKRSLFNAICNLCDEPLTTKVQLDEAPEGITAISLSKCPILWLKCKTNRRQLLAITHNNLKAACPAKAQISELYDSRLVALWNFPLSLRD